MTQKSLRENSDVQSEIEQTLSFIIEIEKLKNVFRKTKPVGLERYENSAEHSWHVCLSALMLKDFADEDIDVNRVIKMLLIHDLGEIDAGDTIIYQSETKENKLAEEEGVKRVLSLLPGNKLDEYLALWLEFEAGETPDSRFARAIDRVPPLLHNLNGDFHSWRKHDISKESVLGLNSRIAEGSEALWKLLENKISNEFDQGNVRR
ncbi:HD domain-containing protein [Aliikangiella sp. G2MR2-5]|uniref:HD domain-containing protein n=1 Tax=Aliikangiella sp. G2MR2-5 TaxID=2788943 RepID=UPI001AEF0369|nr:HD domain-containing protein [Aliikangiella sp. G2MR2-5]